MLNTVTEDVVAEITDKIVKVVNPLKIILFGSYAKGEAGPNSDLDFLVVEEEPFGPDRSRKKETSKLWRVLADIDFPKDLLVFSNDEVNYWKDSINHVIARVIREERLSVKERDGAKNMLVMAEIKYKPVL